MLSDGQADREGCRPLRTGNMPRARADGGRVHGPEGRAQSVGPYPMVRRPHMTREWRERREACEPREPVNSAWLLAFPPPIHVVHAIHVIHASCADEPRLA